MNDNFQYGDGVLPFAIDAETQTELDAIAAEFDRLNETFGASGPSKELYSERIAAHRRLDAHLDALDGIQAATVAELSANAANAREAALNALVTAGIATPETTWAFEDRLTYCQPVVQARDALQLVAQWTSSGTRQVSSQAAAYCDRRYSESRN